MMLSLTTLKSVASAALVALLFSTHIVSAQDFSIGQPMENCLAENYTTSVGDGSETVGFAFCAGKYKKGILINSLEFQGDVHAIRGMVVHYTDGTSDQFGYMKFRKVEASRYVKMDFDPLVDSFTQVKLWKDAANAVDNLSMGRLAINLSNGFKMDLMRKNPANNPGIALDVGKSGMLLGIAGRAEGGMDRLEFIFAKERIRTRSIENMVLKPSIDEINARKGNEERGFAIETLDSVGYTNYLDTDLTVSMNGRKDLQTSTWITKTTTDTFHLGLGYEYKASIGVPELGSVETTKKMDVFWEHIETRTRSDVTTETISRGWDQSPVLKPHTAIRCDAWAFKGTPVAVTWTGMSRITFSDETYMEWESEGDYNTAQYSLTSVSCRPDIYVPLNATSKLLGKGAKFIEENKRNIGARSRSRLSKLLE